MLKAAAVFAIGVAFVLGNVVSAGAVSVISQGTGTDANESCSSATLGICAGGVVVPVVPTNGNWQSNNPGGPGTGVWVSYNVLTGTSFNLLGNSTTIPGATFSEILPSGPGTLALAVWADDTARVSVDGVVRTPAVGTAPQFATDGVCAAGKLGCQPGEQGDFTVLLGAGAHTLAIEVFQVNAFSFGTLWSGTFTPSELTPVPEPASILLLGSALAAAGVASRRRWLKK